jgi:hypothetical protein
MPSCKSYHVTKARSFLWGRYESLLRGEELTNADEGLFLIYSYKGNVRNQLSRIREDVWGMYEYVAPPFLT